MSFLLIFEPEPDDNSFINRHPANPCFHISRFRRHNRPNLLVLNCLVYGFLLKLKMNSKRNVDKGIACHISPPTGLKDYAVMVGLSRHGIETVIFGFVTSFL
jgi:hypothetical protein